MLKWALIFLVVALLAALFGFGGIASGAAGIAKLLFVLFLVVFVISLVLGLVRRINSERSVEEVFAATAPLFAPRLVWLVGGPCSGRIPGWSPCSRTWAPPTTRSSST